MDSLSLPPVISDNDVEGRIVGTIPTSKTGHPDVVIRFADGRQVQVSADHLQQGEDGSYRIIPDAAPLSGEQASGLPPETVLTIPVLAETLYVQKREVETGRVRLIKSVHEQEEIVDEPLLREEVTVERIPINQIWEGPAPSLRYEGDVLVVPLLEEVLVVEKRLRLKEELHIRRIQQTVHAPQTVTVRSEEVTLERIKPETVEAAE